MLQDIESTKLLDECAESAGGEHLQHLDELVDHRRCKLVSSWSPIPQHFMDVGNQDCLTLCQLQAHGGGHTHVHADTNHHMRRSRRLSTHLDQNATELAVLPHQII